MTSDPVLRELGTTAARLSAEIEEMDAAAAQQDVSVDYHSVLVDGRGFRERLRRLALDQATAKLDNPSLTKEELVAIFAAEYVEITREADDYISRTLDRMGMSPKEWRDELRAAGLLDEDELNA